jgi:hypothetical protein
MSCCLHTKSTSSDGTIFITYNGKKSDSLKLQLNEKFYLDSATYLSQKLVLTKVIIFNDTINLPLEQFKYLKGDFEVCDIKINVLDTAQIRDYEPLISSNLKYLVLIHNQCNFGNEKRIGIRK